jgi:hypothetical protein
MAFLQTSKPFQDKLLEKEPLEDKATMLSDSQHKTPASRHVIAPA